MKVKDRSEFRENVEEINLYNEPVIEMRNKGKKESGILFTPYQ